MHESLRPLLTDAKKIKSALEKRKKTKIEKTISSSQKTLLEEKAALEKQDGWEILRKRKKSYRMGKDKPIDEQLEDELWTIVAKMGFNELSDGRNFTISVGPDVNPRQIDVFAKDDETALFIECTSSIEPQKKRMDKLIEKISSIRTNVYKSINSHYGRELKLKLRWIIATRNIEWGYADLQKAKAEKIVVLTENEINYFKKLAELYKNAAKYQFLSYIFVGESIKGLGIAVPATRGKMGGETFYNFLINPKELIKIAYVSHKACGRVEDLETYQRMLAPKRLKAIAKYIDHEGQFPTNIVVNIKEGIRFEKRETVGDSSFGTLYLPDKYGSAWVIDGQHRLYGFVQSKRFSNINDKTTFPVLAYENLPSKKEAELFVDINCQQVRVAKNLLNEIYITLNWDSDNYNERVDALCSRVVMSLDNRATSPFKNRIITTNKSRTNVRCLTLTSFVDGFKDNKFFGEEQGSKIKAGYLSASDPSDLEATMQKATDILSEYFLIFAKEMPDHWNFGDAKEGYLCTNNAIRSLLIVLRAILKFVGEEQYLEISLLGAEDIMPYVKQYTEPIIKYLKNATSEEIQVLRSRQALKGVDINAKYMMSSIQKELPDFRAQGLQEFIDNQDESGTKEAHGLIDKLEQKMFSLTISELKKNYLETKPGDSSENWWFMLPESVRTPCVERWDKDKGKKEKVQYLCLIDLREIAHAHWDLLNKYYSFSKDGGKTKQTEWIRELNDIRNITHHAPKWPATKDQVIRVKQIYNQVMKQFGENC